MKAQWITAILTTFLISAFFAEEVGALNIGEAVPSPKVKMKSVDGTTVSIADVKKEKGTLVIFSCNHCPFVKAWETRIASIGNDALKKGIGVIQINSNDPVKQPLDGYDQMQQRAKERGFQFPYVVDDTSGVAHAFGATRTPEVFLFDNDNKLVYHGAVDDDKNEATVSQHFLKDALEALLAGQEIEHKETKSIGCSIKWYKNNE